jgi:hypothetical protein
MHDIQLVQISNSANNLFEKLTGLYFFKPRSFDDIIEEFSFFGILHDEKQMLCGFDNLSGGKGTS